MTDAAIFHGNYANIVTRKTRSVFVVEIEITIERYQEFVAAFGGPLPGKEIPVAICLLDPKTAASEPRKPPSAPAPREPGKYAGFPLAKQAAIRCATPEFWAFLEIEMPGGNVGSAEEAAVRVRCFCRVESRKEIVTGTEEGECWLELDQRFLDWKHAVPLAEPTR